MTTPTSTAPGLIERFVRDTLASDAALIALGVTDVIDGLAVDTVRPFILIEYVWSRDTYAIPGIRVHTHALYQVRVSCDRATVANMPAIANRIDALLHGARTTNVDGHILACHRDAPLKHPPEHSAAGTYYSQGGTYRFLVQEV